MTTATETVPLNDTAPLFPERTSSLAANRIQAFDFGFSKSPDIDQWSGAPFAEPATARYTPAANHDRSAFAANQGILHRRSAHDDDIGLGISCDPNLVSNNNYRPTAVSTATLLPATTYHPAPPPPPHHAGAFYHNAPTYPNQIHGLPLPTTPQHHQRVPHPHSPSFTSPRRRSQSQNRKSSRHRRTKSSGNNGVPTTTPPRQHPERGNFVNFTPQDSGKILNGVAPSGSSKTKARREKEALDKRRRLSQAAVRAIVEAGGDPATLSKAGVVL